MGFCVGLTKVSNAISNGLENYFYWHGVWIATNPFKTIALSLSAVALCGIGLINFHQENNMVKLWIPKGSDFARNNEWLWQNFPPDTRFNSLILFDEKNILRPEVIQQMYKIHKDVLQICTVKNQSWEELCVKVPVVKESDIRSDFSGLPSSLDPSVAFYPDLYCPVVESLPTSCLETSLLELFAADGEFSEESEREIDDLSQERLLDLINRETISGLFLQQRNFSEYLGGVERDADGRVVGAKATHMRWFGRANSTEIRMMGEKESSGKSTEEDLGMEQQPVDSETLDFEKRLLELLSDTKKYPQGLDSRANVQRSYGDVSTEAIWDDVTFLTVGFILIFIYVQITLGKFNRVEQRAFLAAMGLTSCGLATLASFGICSALGLDYGPMHSIIPCLFIGLGVDDMFIIVQALNNAEDEDKVSGVTRSLPERIGRAIKSAGVGITVTSMTDVMVFSIGGTTSLPSLRSYSLYTALGIAATYALQATFFVAWLSLDQRRIDEKRDGMFCCLKLGNDWTPNKFSQRSFLAEGFEMLGKVVTKPMVKASIIAVTAVMFCLGCWGTSLLEVEFQYVRFLPEDSRLYEWFSLRKTHFPGKGEMGSVYLSGFELHKNLGKVKSLVEELRNNSDVVVEVSSWYPGFETYVDENFRHLLSSTLSEEANNVSREFFQEKLTQYLFSPQGARFVEQFDFDGKIECGVEAPEVLFSSLEFYHRQHSTSRDSIRAMNWVKDLVSSIGFPGKAFAMSQTYSRWEIDEIIATELYRNLLLAVVCVGLTTLVLIADFRSAFLVLVCVVMTLVDVGGAMHAWDLTIDIVASTNLIISVGLCVDFSAHVAHGFMVQRGESRDDRVRATLHKIGPAVFNGGISTLIAVLMLLNSKSHVFIAYFKVFFLMITLGLFHGLVFLPVLLSLLGSKSHYQRVEAANVDKSAAASKAGTVKDGLDDPEEALATLVLPSVEGGETDIGRLKETSL